MTVLRSPCKMLWGTLSGTGRDRKFFCASVQAMPPIVKENENSTSRPETVQRPSPVPTLPGDSAIKQQPVALEVPVTINGARAVEGSDKREPFSESTKTVLIFGNGAVIRLTSSVAPGQLLFLTNERTKKEVVCQVVKSKNYRNISGYVELEFTESAVGFWGMRFPGDRIGSAPAPAPAPPAVRPSASNGSQVPARPAATKIGELPVSSTPSNGAAKPSAPAPVASKSTSPVTPIIAAGSSIASPPPDSATLLGAPKQKTTEIPVPVAPNSASTVASEVNRVVPSQKKLEPVFPIAVAPPIPAAPKITPESARQSASPNFPTFD